MTTEDLQLLDKAVQMAQNGDKAAYFELEKLYKNYPHEPNLLIWLIYTAPAPAVAGKYLDKLKKVEPANPAISQLEQWLWRQTARRPAPRFFRYFLFIPALAALATAIFLAIPVIALFTEMQDFRSNAVEIGATTATYIPVYPRKALRYFSPQVQFRAQNGELYIVTLPIKLYTKPEADITYIFSYHKNNPGKVKVDDFAEDIKTMWLFGSCATIFGLLAVGCAVAAFFGLRKQKAGKSDNYQPPKPFSTNS